MSSNHRHGKSVYAASGDVDTTLTDHGKRIADLEAAVMALQPVPATPTPPTPTGLVVTPTDNIPALIAAGSKNLILRAGTYRFGFGSAHRAGDGIVSLQAYPGDPRPIIDGTLLDPHFVYLGAGSDWRIGALDIIGFSPSDSGVIGPGDGSRLTMQGTKMRFGAGAIKAGAEMNRHLVYFHGTDCIGLIEDCDFVGAPGAAIHCYTGSPVVTVNRGSYVGSYRGTLVYNGRTAINDAAVKGTTIDAEYKPGTLVLNGCSGGTGGTVRTYVA